MLTVSQTDLVADYPQFASVIAQHLALWRGYLLDRTAKPGESQHHVFVLGPPSSMGGDFHPKSLHYLLRAVDATIGLTSRKAFVYSKLMRVIIVSPLVPARPAGWTNTRIYPGRGRLCSPQTVQMLGFGDFLETRVSDAFSQEPSEAQKQKIAQAVLNDPRKALNSESYRVHKLTQKLLKKD